MTTPDLLELPTVVGTQAVTRIQDKVVLLILTLRAPGNERVVRDKSVIKTNANLNRLHLGKRLLECSEQKAITVLDGQMRDWIARLSLPSPFKAGTHVIALGLLDVIDNGLCTFQEQRAAAVDAFVEVYDDAVAGARTSLGDMFKADEYMSTEDVRRAYTMTWQYVTLAPPSQMETLSQEIFERERERLQAQWDGAIDDMRGALQVGLGELVDDMVKRLDGDPKKFKPTKLLERFDEFLKTFDARNVTNDSELQALADKARALLQGVDTDALKESADLRERVRTGMKAAQDTLGQLETVGKGQRRITFEDE